MGTAEAGGGADRIRDSLRAAWRWWQATRPVDPELASALSRRWQELPDHVKTSAQLLGRRTAGCEGTHGVFPSCNLACTPCYHGREANRVRVDGPHTIAEVDRQMTHLRDVRGPGQHAQLIGGEVTLLDPDDHAAALITMRHHARKPMSMTHGDFDYQYLERLAIGSDGRRRFDLLRFAGHFDSLMLGRRGHPRPVTEAELHADRRAFVQKFERLEAEQGVQHDLAHNMTVTPRNLGQVAEVTRVCLPMGYGMLSFQPAARVGNPSRWRESYEAVTIDAVWRELERGVGRRLPWRHLQMGDERCNRAAYGLMVGTRWIPLLDDRDPRDLAVRDVFLDRFGGMDFERPLAQVITACARVAAHHPAVMPAAVRWAGRLARRIGLRGVRSGRPRAMTFVVHAFMDAAVVQAAWRGMEAGVSSDDPAVGAAQERLRACSYGMAHPEDGRIVPACVQHSVLDLQENRRLLRELPLAPPA
ncbi:MAG: radical SAM domain-containing protein, partial [Actinomycetota bacterium]|nr:radical SAM domain-containing protein [Actinomycetota bacterium]